MESSRVFDRAALWIYLGSFCLLIAAGLGFPIPEEVPIVVSGAMVGHAREDPTAYDAVCQVMDAFALTPPEAFPWVGLVVSSEVEVPQPTPQVRLLWEIMLPVLILGVVISDGLLYGMGRFWGPRLLRTPWMKRLLSPQRYQRIEENFHKYGVLVLLFARFLPTIRSPIFIIAGILRVPFKRFVLADGLYAIPGVSLLFFLAYWFGDAFRDLVMAFERRVDSAKPILILLALVAVTAYLIYHFFRHPVATGDPREELPVIGGQVAAKMTCPDNQPPILSRGEWVCPDGSRPVSPLKDPQEREESPLPGSPDSATESAGK
jgi:membrane protein DedA with SNARE-associated domain